ncbi:MAG: hypothetical protein ACXWMS_01980 [Syntrophales bacterium]
MPENVSRKLAEYIKEKALQERSVYSQSAIRQQDPLSEDWEPN